MTLAFAATTTCNATVMNIHTPMRLSELSRQELLEESSLNCTKYLSCLASTNGQTREAGELFTRRFAKTYAASTMQQQLETGVVPLTLKAAVAPATTTDATWAKPLVGIEQWAGGFLAIAHSQSLLGRIPNLQLIPFHVKVPFQTGEGAVAWVKEMFPIPVSSDAFGDGATLTPTKVGRIVPFSEEFARLASVGTAPAMRQGLIGKVNAFIDKQFLDPTVAAVVGLNPASITNPTTPLTGTADVRASFEALNAAFYAGRPGATKPALLANGNYSQKLRGLVPGIGIDPIETEAAGSNLIMVDASAVFYADGGIEITFTRDATIQMNDAPDAPPTASTVLLPLWQVNCVGYRILRTVSWAAAPGAVKYSTMP